MMPHNVSPEAGLWGLLLFFVFFMGMVIWIYRPGSKANYDAKAKIPLQDDDEKND